MVVAALVSLLSFVPASPPEKAADDTKAAIEEVVVLAYVEGLINAKDFDAARRGIHEDFKILGNRGTQMSQRGLEAWIDSRSRRMHLPPANYVIPLIDTQGKAAVVRVDLTRGKLHATDYVFLYQFDDGWRIVSAIDDVEMKE